MVKVETFTYIEVENATNVWAVELHECESRMKPVIVKFAIIDNDLSSKDVIYIDCTLTDTKPEKIIQGINGGLAERFIEVGFWRIKQKSLS